MAGHVRVTVCERVYVLLRSLLLQLENGPVLAKQRLVESLPSTKKFVHFEQQSPLHQLLKHRTTTIKQKYHRRL